MGTTKDETRIFSQEKTDRKTSYKIDVPGWHFEQIQDAAVKKLALILKPSGLPRTENSSIDLYGYGIGTNMYIIFTRKPQGCRVDLMHKEPPYE